MSEDKDSKKKSKTTDPAPIDGLIADIFGDSDDEGAGHGSKAHSSSDANILSKSAQLDKPNKIDDKSKIYISDDDYDIDKYLFDQNYNDIQTLEDSENLGLSEKRDSSPNKDLDKLVGLKVLVPVEGFKYEFDKMMEKRKLLNRLSRKRNKMGVDEINDNDDEAFKLIEDMMNASREDRESNEQGKIALKKLKLLPVLKTQVIRPDLAKCLIEQGLFQAIYNWLIPLPDGSLPHMKIRSTLLGLFEHLPPPNPEELKRTGLGKIINILSKHPHESKPNREIARQLIASWSRVIFGLDRNLNESSNESSLYVRKKFDSRAYNRSLYIETLNSQKNLTNDANEDQAEVIIPRARVPQPSSKDYHNRPISNVSISNTESQLLKPTGSLHTLNKKLQRVRRAK